MGPMMRVLSARDGKTQGICTMVLGLLDNGPRQIKDLLGG
jgi:hypothetical protein